MSPSSRRISPRRSTATTVPASGSPPPLSRRRNSSHGEEEMAPPAAKRTRSSRRLRGDNAPSPSVEEQEKHPSSSLSSSPRPDAAASYAPKYVEKSPELEQLLERLKAANDLPACYACLKIIREEFAKTRSADNNAIPLLTDKEQELINQANLAVPYLMCKKAIDLCTLPRSLGGLALSSAKARTLCLTVFEKCQGLSCCSSSMTDKKIVRLCKGSLTVQDAIRVLPKLAEVGIAARSKVNEIRESILKKAEV